MKGLDGSERKVEQNYEQIKRPSKNHDGNNMGTWVRYIVWRIESTVLHVVGLKCFVEYVVKKNVLCSESSELC
jgi:hypothetical protein